MWPAKSIHLQNKLNPEQYRVFVIPGSKTIHWSNLRKIKEFYDGGGKVIATTRLPDKSAEFGKDAEVRQAVEHIFGPRASAADGKTPPPAPTAGYTVRVNRRGGRAYFLPKPSAAAIQAVLDDASEVYDVQFETGLQLSGGNLSYIHKVIDLADVYFFANSSDTSVDSQVRIRGKRKFELWDPHTGEILRGRVYAHRGQWARRYASAPRAAAGEVGVSCRHLRMNGAARSPIPLVAVVRHRHSVLNRSPVCPGLSSSVRAVRKA